MQPLDLKTLISHLSPELRSALESAAGLCVNRKHSSIGVDHWLLQLFKDPGVELRQVINSQQVATDLLIEDIEKRLQQLTKGFDQTPTLSADTVSLVQDAWLITSLTFSSQIIRVPHLLLALLNKDSFNLMDTVTRQELHKLSREKLQSSAEGKGDKSDECDQSTTIHQNSALDKYSTDMIQHVDTDLNIVGRDLEIRQIIDILCRKRQNNPILVGDAGVGKTAIVEGLAQRIHQNNVPDNLKQVELRNLDLGLLQAGASIKGEFENRLKDIINEVRQSERPIILFIDEAHTLIGAGGTAGQSDAANLLKPALARGELKTIAATTWREYKQYFEKDAALTRRFQPVKVTEPDLESAIQMSRMAARVLEKYHGVRVHDDAVTSAVNLSVRYLPERQLPDKAISLIDTACSRVSLSQHTTPAELQALQEKQFFLTSEQNELKRDQTAGADVAVRIEKLQTLITESQLRLTSLEQRWQQEKDLAQKVFELERAVEQKESLSSATPSPLPDLQQQLKQLQQDSPMVLARVDSGSIASVIASWTGIPAGKMLSDDIQKLLSLEKTLQQRIIGQQQAITEICRTIRIARAGLSNPGKPAGVFLMCGPSGVGKTETALALADALYGGEQNLTVINMTEFKEAHKVSMLLGAPAGYVGYGEGGVLTEAIRRKPFSVLLLDEMEKAHPGVHDIFYQIFDKGRISDSEGREIDFRQTVIIMTTNAADQAVCHLAEQYQNDLLSEHHEFLPSLTDSLLTIFKPAFLGRVSIIPYFPLTEDDMKTVCRLFLNRVKKSIQEHYKAEFVVDDTVIDQLVAWNSSPQSGARAIEQQINRHLLPQLATDCLSQLAKGLDIESVQILMRDSRISYQLNGTPL